MTRLACRTSLVVAFYLLTSIAIAYAECAPTEYWTPSAGGCVPR